MKNPSGLCMCGCGQVAPPSPTSRRGYKAGEPLMFIRGHSSRKLGPNYAAQDCGHDTPCWVWQKSVSKSTGYARIWNGTGHDMAHRVYYERFKGPIPDGLQIDHLCRNRRCVNPDHLEPVTHAENGRRGIHAKLDHEKAAAIRASDESGRVLAERYGVHPCVIYDVRSGRKWAPDVDGAKP